MSSTMFHPAMLQGRPIHLIGLGALGGPIADSFFRQGVPELHLWDPDIVESRNRFNQRVFAQDVDSEKPKSKVEVRARILRDIYPESETKLVLHPERFVAGAAPLSGIVISAVDWNRIRYKEIWPCVRMNPDVSFFAEGRVGIDGGKAIGLDPNNEYHVDRYEQPVHAHPDPENAERDAACKSEFPLPENAEAVAAEVKWRLTRWLHLEQGSVDPYDNLVSWQYIPRTIVLTEQWETDTISAMKIRYGSGFRKLLGRVLDVFDR